MRALIAVLPGDGIGPEVTRAAECVLARVSEMWGHEFRFQQAQFGGSAIDAVGEPFPQTTRTLVSEADAVLLGAVGGPRWSNPSAKVRPEQGLLDLRKSLGAFANLRPVKPHPALLNSSPLRADRVAGTDILFVRELTGGAYFGTKARSTDADGTERAVDYCEYTSTEIARVVRVAARAARERRGQLLSVDKANVLETSRLWRKVTTQIMAEEFPDVTLEHQLVDAFAMQLILQPARYDVVVTENLFGDILTDEAAVLAGSIGLLPSASIGEARSDGSRPGIYEPIHGSAPDIANADVANPVGAILSAAMMMRHTFQLSDEARAIEVAVHETIRDGWRTRDCAANEGGACTTSQFTERTLERLHAPVARR